MKTNFYVDGFNLYYGCLKDTPLKWLDLLALCRKVFPKNQIHRIRYFTSLVKPTVNDPQKPQRQETLIRALRTIPCLSVHYGYFLSHPTWMPLANPAKGGPQMAQVIKTEEKGSDVNLATFLLLDAFNGDYEVAIVISNDSDLLEPIKIVQSRFGLPVGILNPHRRPSAELRSTASFYRYVRKSSLGACQFPPTLTDEKGAFSKPSCW